MEEFSEQGEKERELFKIVRRRAIVGTMLIFLGIFMVQIMVYAVVMLSVPFFFRSGTGSMEKVEIAKLLSDKQLRQGIVEWVALITSACYIIWCGFLYMRSDWRKKADYREVFERRHLLQIVLIGFCGCVVMIVALTVLQQIFPAFFAEYQKGMDNFNTGSLEMFLYVLLLGPVAEELIFRGVLFDRLYLACPFYIANFIQAALFGIYHRNLIQGIYAFCFGLLLGLLHQTGGSILNNILAHIVFNVTNFLVPVLYRGIAGIYGGSGLLVLVCLFGLFYGVRSVCLELRQTSDSNVI